MDFTFLSVTLVLIIFLFISYFLNVIRLSTPLILIYLVFCTSYVLDSETAKKATPPVDGVDESKNVKSTHEKVKIPAPKTKNTDNIYNKKLDISKPVVSLNPKPIVIDTNIIIQKEELKTKINNSQLIAGASNIAKDNKNKSLDMLKLKEVMICRGVYKRNPIKPGFKFANNVDSLFCYTKISNKGQKQEIKHLWFYEDKLITPVTYNIKTSHNYRSWSKKTILPSQIGQWRVDIIDNKERVLGSRKFEITPLNNAF
tara:strand:+ start:1969 stop:2739 length:771 start_codon:yes stop_codon:yes gene_type:complete